MAKNTPRYMHSKFDSQCCDCGAPIATGELIRYLGRGRAQCQNCAPRVADSDQQHPVAQQAAGSDPASKWAAALAWDDSTPQPGASIGVEPQRGTPLKVVQSTQPSQELRDQQATTTPVVPHADSGKPYLMPGAEHCEQCGKLDELSHNDATGMALCQSCDIAETEAVAAGIAESIADAETAEPAEPDGFTQSERAEGMTCELLVVLVNALDVAGVAGRATIADYCRKMAAVQTSERRAKAWRAFGQAAS